MDDTSAYIAYVRAEAIAAAGSIHELQVPRVHPSLIRENRWRACRYGMQATMIDPVSEDLLPLLDWLEQRLDKLAKQGADCSELEIVFERIPHWRKHGDGAEMQRQLYETTDGFSAMVQAMREQDGWML